MFRNVARAWYSADSDDWAEQPGQEEGGEVSEVREECGKCLGQLAEHAFGCSCGAARLRAHNAIVRTCAHVVGRAGAFVDIERHVPELYQVVAPSGGEGSRRRGAGGRAPVSGAGGARQEGAGGRTETEQEAGKGQLREAIMDVVVQWPTDAFPRWVDINIRSPYVPSVEHADRVPGAAAALGDNRKRQRYGEAVLALTVETGGRLSVQGQRTMTLLSADSRAHGKRRFDRQMPGMSQRTLRSQVEATLLRQLADISLLAMGAAVGAYGGAAGETQAAA